MTNYNYLNGLRGWLALIVINEHFLKILAPLATLDEALKPSNSSAIHSLVFPPFNLMSNGAWAVAFFFVLSGFVISASYFKVSGDERNILSKVFARYLRLAIPIFFSLLIIYIFNLLVRIDINEMMIFYQFNFKINDIDLSSIWVVIEKGFFGAIFQGDYNSNPALWTMGYEFIGSVILFFIMAFFNQVKSFKYYFPLRILTYLFLIYLFKSSLLLGFILGMLAADLYNKKEVFNYLSLMKKVWSVPILVAGLFMVGYMIQSPSNSLYSHVITNLDLEFLILSEYIINIWGSFLLLIFLLFNKYSQRILSKPFSLFLGRHSFSIYITHFPVILWVTYTMGFDHSPSAKVMASLPLIFIMAYLFTIVVIEPSQKLSVIVGGLFKKKRALTMN